MTTKSSSFQSIFFEENTTTSVRVPDYQRAYSWEKTQIELFIGDLKKYKSRPNEYYFGHYIVETADSGWDLVDGQQRVTTFVLFLMICRILSPNTHAAFTLIERFSTVSYDNFNLNLIKEHLIDLPESFWNIEIKHDVPESKIINAFSIEDGTLTLSLKRIVWALLRFYQTLALENDNLNKECIDTYINVIMNAHCSLHIAKDKSVAVNVFEMHNTRGIRLTTIEIVKAKLMQFVHDKGGTKEDREKNVETIQSHFGAIFRMEELLAAKTFRGELSLEHLLRLHLRVVDDGSKRDVGSFDKPAVNADIDAIVKYLDAKLNFSDLENKERKLPEIGVKYALELAAEFEKSVRIVSEELPKWDKDADLVGDVLILERDLSCQFFLLACRRFETEEDSANGRLSEATLILWEKLLFTRDFHDKYYKLRYGDNFQELFAKITQENDSFNDVIKKYLADGFRPHGYTTDLQGITRKYLHANRDQILKRAFHWWWWKRKMIYAIYKYEKSIKAELREVVKGKISGEHILPQNWYWIRDEKGPSGETLNMEEDTWKNFHEDIDACINGIGNLLLITPSENSSKSNYHPKDKIYDPPYSGGSYKDHDDNRGQWEDPQKWKSIIEARGVKIYDFMLENLVGESYKAVESPDNSDRQPSD